MDNENNNTTSQDWLDEILGKSPQKEELGPDEGAVYSAGLTDPKDAELERILSEDWSKEDDAPPQEDLTQRFTPIEEDRVEDEIPAEPEAPTQTEEKGRPKRKKGSVFWAFPT